MISIDDFTNLPEGAVVLLEGTVVRCPVCGRTGVMTGSDDANPCCIHREQSTMLGDGMLTEPTEACPLPHH